MRNQRLYVSLTIKAQKALSEKLPPFQSANRFNNPWQVIDFFSGCGGMSLGFAAVSLVVPSYSVIGGCDIREDALESFSTNLNANVSIQDIRALVTSRKSILDYCIRKFNYDERKKLIVVGCPPCQGFSAHQKKHGILKDERNSLVECFAKVSASLNPEIIVMENVPELLSDKYRKYYLPARKLFVDAGYVVKEKVYNSAEFNVPQNRRRAIVIAVKKDFSMPEGLLKPEQYLTVKDAIGGLKKIESGQGDPTDTLHQSASHKEQTIQTIKQVKKDGGSRPKGVGPKCLDKVKGFGDVYGRLYWNKPSVTITRSVRNPASGRYVHPDSDRGLTLREAALLQGFPVGFKFIGNTQEIAEQIGEAVPPPLAAGIASYVFSEIIQSNDYKK